MNIKKQQFFLSNKIKYTMLWWSDSIIQFGVENLFVSIYGEFSSLKCSSIIIQDTIFLSSSDICVCSRYLNYGLNADLHRGGNGNLLGVSETVLREAQKIISRWPIGGSRGNTREISYKPWFSPHLAQKWQDLLLQFTLD